MSLGLLDLTESQLLAMTETELLAMEETGTGGGGTPDSETTTCLYNATAIADIKSVVDGLATAVANLQADITAIKARMPQTGTVSTLTADDVWVYPVSDESVPATDVMTIMIQRTGGILANKNALSTIDTVVDAIKAKTDKLPAEPAAKSDVQITVNADGIDVPTAAENASAVWSAATRTLTSTTGGGATAQEVWQYTNRTLTSTIPTVSDIQSGLAKTSDLSSLAKTSDLSGLATSTNLSALQTTANAIKTQTDKIPSTAVTPSDITALRTHGDSNWSTATGFATPADVAAADLTQVYSALTFITALLGHWTVSGNILTTYDDSGAVLKTYALTRDSNNNITSIS
ncbi:MAG: hypothetical protein Q4D62_13985 [Planctomycetia bacterium]|nr:hypothetical protein [Planctomycetia bacterium]